MLLRPITDDCAAYAPTATENEYVYVKPTEYTQRGNCRFLMYLDGKSALAGEGGGFARPLPFTLDTIMYVVYAPAERADTLRLFHLYPYMYSVVKPLLTCQYRADTGILTSMAILKSVSSLQFSNNYFYRIIGRAKKIVFDIISFYPISSLKILKLYIKISIQKTKSHTLYLITLCIQFANVCL